jgi:hypothetical protein
MSYVEDYLKARSACEKTLAKVAAFHHSLASFGQALEGTPHAAQMRVPQDWLTREEVRQLLDAACIAWDTMNNAWARIPAEQQKHIAAPFRRIDRSS